MKFSIFILTAVFQSSSVFAAIRVPSVCVTADRANLRSAPTTKSLKTWEVYQHMPFKVLDQKSDWVFVEDLEGDKHWVAKQLVGHGKKCAVVKSEYANLRTGPGTEYEQDGVIPKVGKYTAFEVVSQKGNWVKVRGENKKIYWLSSDLLWIQ